MTGEIAVDDPIIATTVIIVKCLYSVYHGDFYLY